MAITTLTPKIRACNINSCSTFRIYDSTLILSTANAGGWDATNEEPINITSATLAYTTPSNSTSVEIDVLANVNAQVVVQGEFLLADIDVTPEDGLYSFTYTLESSDGIVTVRSSLYSLCVARCCVDKLWAKVATNALSEECNCTETKSTNLQKAEIAEGLFNAIKFGAACNSTSVKDAILKKLQRICNLENCNCK